MNKFKLSPNGVWVVCTFFSFFSVPPLQPSLEISIHYTVKIPISKSFTTKNPNYLQLLTTINHTPTFLNGKEKKNTVRNFQLLYDLKS